MGSHERRASSGDAVQVAGSGYDPDTRLQQAVARARARTGPLLYLGIL